MRERARAFLKQAQDRRTVRDFSDRPIPRDIIETCILAAGTAPNGAHRQPWRFVAVSDPEIKRAIRVAAEEEEKAFYEGRAPDDWLEALAPLGTDEKKPFLEGAPYLIVVFAESYAVEENGEKSKNYYVSESVGIATGILVTAIHENRRLWTILAGDVADDGNTLPEQLRAQIFYLAEFTGQHSAKVLSGKAGVEILIEINMAVMRGLRQQEAATP